MRKQQLYTLHIDTIKKLNLNIMRGNRSQFVENAILEKLKLKQTYAIQEYSARQVAGILHAKLNESTDPFTSVLKFMLYEWVRDNE